MFTGIVECVGRLRAATDIAGGRELAISTEGRDLELAAGDSVAVQGTCLTVTKPTADGFACDVLRETMARTKLGRQRPGDALNLERAMRLDTRLGGHLVSGHIDGVGTLTRCRAIGRDHEIDIACDAALLRGMVEKGSVTCDGISLTIAGLDETMFRVCIIPYTWENTSLSDIAEGGPVNIEVDLIGKYVARLLETSP